MLDAPTDHRTPTREKDSFCESVHGTSSLGQRVPEVADLQSDSKWEAINDEELTGRPRISPTPPRERLISQPLHHNTILRIFSLSENSDKP
ncbi:hypothetical protein PtB15_13B261 [Puccinia triticina]|nr:hypothetical protein PtB15_13B261 [Puccinia triticina]